MDRELDIRDKRSEKKRQREKEKTEGEERENRNRWWSQTILHRVLTVDKSIRDSRFDLYDQIPIGATTKQDRAAEIE